MPEDMENKQVAYRLEEIGLHSNAKKGDTKECSNNRTIALISHASKVMLQRTLEPYMEREIAEVQAGFRKGRGTRDHIANLRWLMETTREFGKPVYLCFIDYSKTFDCVDYPRLWNQLRQLGIPEHLTCLMRNLHCLKRHCQN